MTTLSPTRSIARVADDVSAFVKDIQRVYMLDQPATREDDRRAAQRYNLTMPLVVTPLDDQFRPLSYQHHAVTRDISENGVGIVTTNPIPLSHVLLTFKPYHGDSLSVIARVAYCNEIGYYYQMGCEFCLTHPVPSF